VRPVPAGRRPVRAPGTLASHYAPHAQVLLAQTPDDVSYLVSAGAGTGGGTGLLAPSGVPTPDGVVRLSEPDDAPAFARVLYSSLREADVFGLDRVVVLAPPDGGYPGLVEAIRDRLRRAATGTAR
jgi:L-threonylcarbamoyladenylate synthase